MRFLGPSSFELRKTHGWTSFGNVVLAHSRDSSGVVSLFFQACGVNQKLAFNVQQLNLLMDLDEILGQCF